MPSKKHDIAASDFRDPLLKVLGQLTGFKSGVVIKHETVYAPVFQMMGITRDQYGMDGSSSIPLAERWVQGCVNTLIDSGLMNREGKGKWSITQTGITEAQQLIAIAEGSGAVVETEQTSTVGQSVLMGPNRDENLYHSDPYLRALAAEKCTCLGGYTDRSSICFGCLIRGNCINDLAAQLSQLAAKMAAEDRKETAKKQVAFEAARKPDEAPSVPSVPSEVVPLVGLVIPPEARFKHCSCAKAGIVCIGCNQEIPLNDPSTWVRDLGPNKKESAMFHRECYKRIAGK